MGKAGGCRESSHTAGSDLRTVCPALTQAPKGAEVPAAGRWHGPAEMSWVTVHLWTKGMRRG